MARSSAEIQIAVVATSICHVVVGEAKDGLEGVELAREFHPDVVVINVNMPGMNGIEATKLITRELPSTIVVGLSFETGAQIAQSMKAARASTCVGKEDAIENIHRANIDSVPGRRTAKIDNGELGTGYSNCTL